jgi:hypothetical protein
MCVAAMSLCMIDLIVTRKRGDGRYYFALWQSNNNTNKLLLSESAISCLLRVRSVSFISRAKDNNFKDISTSPSLMISCITAIFYVFSEMYCNSYLKTKFSNYHDYKILDLFDDYYTYSCIYRRQTGANGNGILIFFYVAYPWGKHFFYKWDAHGTNTVFDALFCGWIFLKWMDTFDRLKGKQLLQSHIWQIVYSVLYYSMLSSFIFNIQWVIKSQINYTTIIYTILDREVKGMCPSPLPLWPYYL